MPYDYKKEQKSLYVPSAAPVLVEVPAMQFLAVRGSGDPNDPAGEYPAALERLYSMAYALKMSPKRGRSVGGYFPYVVPPLEGLWQLPGQRFDPARKREMRWVALLRLPDFFGAEDVIWAARAVERAKALDCAGVARFRYAEGFCVQCLHRGPYDAEPETLRRMQAFLAARGYEDAASEARPHHEIYLSDPRRTPPERLRTVLRHPVRKVSNAGNAPADGRRAE